MITIADNEKIKDEHDVGYKSLFSKKDTFLHFLRKYIGAEWADGISEDDLILMDKSLDRLQYARAGRADTVAKREPTVEEGERHFKASGA